MFYSNLLKGVAVAAMAVIVAGSAEVIINRTLSAMNTIIEWPAGSPFLFKDHVAFNLFSDGGAVLSKKRADSFKAHSFFQ